MSFDPKRIARQQRLQELKKKQEDLKKKEKDRIEDIIKTINEENEKSRKYDSARSATLWKQHCRGTYQPQDYQQTLASRCYNVPSYCSSNQRPPPSESFARKCLGTNE